MRHLRAQRPGRTIGRISLDQSRDAVVAREFLKRHRLAAFLCAGLAGAAVMPVAHAGGVQWRCQLDRNSHVVAAAAACVLRQARTHLIIVGAWHGTVQIPQLAMDLVARAAQRRPVLLGMEMPVDSQAAVRQYVRSHGGSTARARLMAIDFWKFPDGRATHATLGLIESLQRLRARGEKVGYFAMVPTFPIDPGKVHDPDAFKEAGMARAIRAALQAAPRDALIVALMGDAHSEVTHVPLRVAAYHPLVVDVVAARGTAWNCQAYVCGVHRLVRVPGAGAAPASLYVVRATTDAGIEIDTATLTLPAFTASDPIGPVYHFSAKARVQPVKERPSVR